MSGQGQAGRLPGDHLPAALALDPDVGEPERIALRPPSAVTSTVSVPVTMAVVPNRRTVSSPGSIERKRVCPERRLASQLAFVSAWAFEW